MNPAVTAVAAPQPLGYLLLQRRFGAPEWDAAIRATGIVGLVAIPFVVLVPGIEPLIGLALTTLWLRGPAAGVMPVGLEPVLMLYGRLYPAWLVALVAAGSSAYAETLSLQLMRGVMATRLLARVRTSLQGSRMMTLFERHPGAAVFLAAISPIPDWITRTLASVSRYSARRYVIADTLGRLPKLWIPAALGSVIRVPAPWLAGAAAASVVVGGIAGIWKWAQVKRNRGPALPAAD